MKSKWGKRIGYGIGDLGCNLVFSTMSSYLLIFYTDVFGIAAAAAGTMMLVTKLIDAITDTVMGVVVDKTHTKWGQGRPYFVIGAVPFAVFTVLTFIVPDLSEGGRLIWAYVTYCLLCTAYTIVNIPLNTIVPRLSSDPNERNILVTTRMVCALLGTAIVMSITTPFVRFVGGIVEPGIADPFKSSTAWIVVMGVYGVAAMLIFFLTFASTEEVVPPSVQNETSALKDNIKAMTGQAWLVMIFNFLYFALYVVRSTTVIYFFKYNLQREDLATLVGFLGILSGLPMLLCLPKLEEKFGKRNILFLSVAIYLAGNALILINQASVAFQLAGLVITGLGIYGIFGTVFAMQPDAIDYSEWKKNRSISGTIAAFQGLFVKASMGLASWIIGLYLGMNGYDGSASVQSPAAQQCIQFCYMWIPVILCALLAVTNIFWKLDSCADEMRAELDARRRKLQELVEKW